MPAVSGGKFVVVGGASLLGSHIGELLLQSDARKVLLLDNLALGSTDNIQSLLSDGRCTFVRGDILRLNELFDPFAGADGVFNVAGFLTAPIAANPWMGIDVNVRGAQNVLEACRVQGVKKMIFSSSTGVYGGLGEEPNDESSPLRWGDLPPALVLYCTSKVMGEGLARLYQQRYGIDCVSLRYSAIYGERQHKRAIDATRMVEAYERIRSGLCPIIQGDGNQLQDYVYVGDVARANLLAMERDVSGEGITIATGVNTSQAGIVDLIVKACETDLKPQYSDDVTSKPSPVTRPVFGREAAKRLLGWEPAVSIEEGVRRLVAWLDQQRASTKTV
jgi:UDP-glucose 4-epimerase